MKLSELIKELQHIQSTKGEVEVQIQEHDKVKDEIVNYETFFVVMEEYQVPSQTFVNIRTWPY